MKPTYRNIKTAFWTDAKVDELSAEGRFCLLYLLTCPSTNMAGCYEVSPRRISKDTGLADEQVSRAIEELEGAGIIAYDRDTREVLIVNWGRHNWNPSPKLDAPILEDIAEIKSDRLRERAQATFDALRGRGTEPDTVPDTPSAGVSDTPPDTPSVGYGHPLVISAQGSVIGDSSGVGSGEGEPDHPGFSPPTVEEVEEYARSNCLQVDASRFVATYAAQGWLMGNGLPMRDWRWAVSKWSGNEQARRRAGEEVGADDFGEYD